MMNKVVLVSILIAAIVSIFFVFKIQKTVTQPTTSSTSNTDVSRRNLFRSEDLKELLTSLELFYQTNHSLPAQITKVPQNISKSGADLCQTLVTKYINLLPEDPQQNNYTVIKDKDCNTNYDTGYVISRNELGNEVTIAAPKAEGEQISISKNLSE